MTVVKILELIDSMKSNTLPDHVKIGWIADVEGRALCEIQKMSPEEIELPKGSDDTLVIPEAYSRVYLLYILAMMAFGEGDLVAYGKINAEFESAFAMYARWYIRNR